MKSKKDEADKNWSWQEVSEVEKVLRELEMGDAFSVSMSHDEFRRAVQKKRMKGFSR